MLTADILTVLPVSMQNPKVLTVLTISAQSEQRQYQRCRSPKYRRYCLYPPNLQYMLAPTVSAASSVSLFGHCGSVVGSEALVYFESQRQWPYLRGVSPDSRVFPSLPRVIRPLRALCYRKDSRHARHRRNPMVVPRNIPDCAVTTACLALLYYNYYYHHYCYYHFYYYYHYNY